jgi:hypothetical protein
MVWENVYVAASGGFISTDYFSKNCKRLARTAATHDNIEKIVILYLRDLTKLAGISPRIYEKVLNIIVGF